MSMSRRASEEQQEFWVARDCVAKVPGHVFYERLNRSYLPAELEIISHSLVYPPKSSQRVAA